MLGAEALLQTNSSMSPFTAVLLFCAKTDFLDQLPLKITRRIRSDTTGQHLPRLARIPSMQWHKMVFEKKKRCVRQAWSTQSSKASGERRLKALLCVLNVAKSCHSQVFSFFFLLSFLWEDVPQKVVDNQK